MSVLAQSALGWLVDARSFIDQSYVRCIRWTEKQKSTIVWCGFKRQCFQIAKSHLDVKCGAASAINANVSKKLAQKRKRKHIELNQGEIDIKAFHQRVRCVILDGTLSLVDLAQACGYLNPSEEITQEQIVAFPDCGLSSLCEMAKQLPLVDTEEDVAGVQILDGSCSTLNLDLFSQLTENRSDSAVVVTLMGEEYVIPAHATFLLSDLNRIQPLVNGGKKFNLIIIDPPWENKSVKRSRRYSSLPTSQLKRLPIPLLAAPDCLVVTWVTNRPSHLQCVRDELYPHWGVEVAAEWLWVKVTTSGQFVFPLDSEHKKPYEMLVLGRFNSSTSQSEGNCEIPVMEDHRLIVSVPSTLHSQKPCLSEVLKPYLGPNPECLELFARNLHPGWTSWGNEVLKFQHTSYFTVTPEECEAQI